MTARRALLDGLARDADIFEVLSGLAPLHPRNDTFPGEVFLDLAADALEWCGASRAEPLPLEGLRERFLPEAAFRGRQNAKLRYAVLAAAAVHAGTEPDLLDEVASWQTDDFWQYAVYAAVVCIRAAASRAGVPVHQACQDLDGRPGHPPADSARVAAACAEVSAERRCSSSGWFVCRIRVLPRAVSSCQVGCSGASIGSDAGPRVGQGRYWLAVAGLRGTCPFRRAARPSDPLGRRLRQMS